MKVHSRQPLTVRSNVCYPLLSGDTPPLLQLLSEKGGKIEEEPEVAIRLERRKKFGRIVVDEFGLERAKTLRLILFALEDCDGRREYHELSDAFVAEQLSDDDLRFALRQWRQSFEPILYRAFTSFLSPGPG